MSMIQPKWAERGRIIPLYTEAGPINVLKASLSKWPQIIKAPELTHKWCNYYSPDTIRWLKESHLNFIMVGWSVGFSIKAEKIQRDLVTEFINKCHAEGINVGLYICWANMFWQSMFEDVPESRKWCAVGPDGKTMKKFNIDSRYQSCASNRGCWNDLKERVALAVEADPDLIFFDNVHGWCYCRHCQDLFKKYSKKLLGKAHKLPTDPPVKYRNLSILAKDSILREDKDSEHLRVLLTKLLTDEEICRKRLSAMNSFIKSKGSEVLLAANIHQTALANSACDVFLTETPRFPGTDRKRPITNIALYKYLFATGRGKKSTIALLGQRRLEFGKAPAIQKLALAEGAAFGMQCCSHQIHEFVHKDYNAFFIKNQDYYVGTTPLAKVGVVMERDLPHYVNIVSQNNNFPEQLARHNVMFDLLLDNYLTRKSLKEYHLIILHNAMILDEKVIRLIRSFVKAGGNLLSCGFPSMIRRDFTRRDDFGLRDVFGIGFAEAEKAGRKVENRYGNGCSIFYPYQIARIDASDFSRSLPRIPREFLADLGKLRGDTDLEVTGPRCVLAHLMEKEDEGLIIVHLLNYSCDMVSDVRIRLSNVKNLAGKIRVLSPDKVSRKVTDVVRHEDFVEFSVCEIMIYCAVVVR